MPSLIALALLLVTSVALSQSAAELEKQLLQARDKDKASLLVRLADAHYSNSPQKSLECAAEALSLAEKYQSPAEAVDARLKMAAALIRLGRPENASKEYDRALEEAERSGWEDKSADALHGLGNVGFFTGSYAEARDFYLRALAIRERINDRPGIAKSLNNLGNIAARQTDAAGAALYYQRALELNRELGDRQGQTLALNNLGLVEKGYGNLDKALEYYLEAARLAEEMGNVRSQAMVAVNIAILYGRLGNPAKSAEYALTALGLNRQLGDERQVAASLDAWAGALFKQEKFAEALVCLQEAAELKEKVADLKGLADALGNIANCYKATKDFDRALSYYQRCLSTSERIHYVEGVATTLKEIGDLHIQRGDFRRGEDYLTRSLRLAGDAKSDTPLLGDIHLSLSGLYQTTGDWQKAYEHHRLYGDIRERLINTDSARRISEMQVRFETEKKDKVLALLGKNNQLLQQDNQIQKLRLARERLLVYAIAAVTLAVLAVAFLLFKKYLYLLAFWKKKNHFGHFRLVDQLSAGGMGIIYRAACPLDSGRPVALKVLREEYSADPVLRQRFKNEAVMIDQLHHPHIVRVYERGEHNQRLYIAMELLEGRSLAELIRDGHRLSIQEGLDVMDQLAETLAVIHGKGIVHRDLKPENVMLIEHEGVRNFVKLLDFDIAHNQSLTRLTEAGQILGTVHYLPPEQIAEQQVTAAGDVYSLGVVAYELFTLEKPFRGEAPIEVVRQILENRPVPPVTLCPSLPGELSDLILLMIDKTPLRRPGDEALLAAIREIRRQVDR